MKSVGKYSWLKKKGLNRVTQSAIQGKIISKEFFHELGKRNVTISILLSANRAKIVIFAELRSAVKTGIALSSLFHRNKISKKFY